MCTPLSAHKVRRAKLDFVHGANKATPSKGGPMSDRAGPEP